MQIIGIFDILMLAIRSAMPPRSPADMPSTSSMMSTVLESFTLKYYAIYWNMCFIHSFIHKNYNKKDQPICLGAQWFIIDKFLYRVCIASTNSFNNFAISLATAVTSINLKLIRVELDDKKILPQMDCKGTCCHLYSQETKHLTDQLCWSGFSYARGST